MLSRIDRSAIRIIVAEDDPEIRHELSALLDLNGYTVVALASGAALLDAVSGWVLREEPEIQAELIVTDVRMPGVSGLSIVEGLRASGWKRPIVVISAFADPEMTSRVSRLIGVALLPKPFDPATFERLIAELSSATAAAPQRVTDR